MLGMSNVDPRPATTPADEDDLDEIKSAVLAKLALDGIVNYSTLPLRPASFIGVALSALAILAIAIYFVL